MKITCHIEGGPDVTFHNAMADDLYEYIKGHLPSRYELDDIMSGDEPISFDLDISFSNETEK